MEIVPDLDRPTPGLDRAPDPSPATLAAPAPDAVGGLIDSAYGLDGVPPDVLDRALQARNEIVVVGQRPDPAVDRAVASIGDRLESSVLNPVTATDLRAIESTVDGLTPTQATRTFERLSDDQLEELGEQLQDRTPAVGGFDGDERSAFYGTLAGRLDGAQLTRVADALGSPRGNDGIEGQRLGAAISDHAPAGVQIGFVREAGAIAGDDREAAFAAGEVLAGLRGGALDRALGTLTPDGLRDVIAGSVEASRTTQATLAGGYTTLTYDADTAGRALESIAGARDPYLRAVAVEAGAAQIREIEDARHVLPGTAAHPMRAPDQLRGGLAAILDRDPGAVIASLEQHVDRDGRALSTYVGAMLDAGRGHEVGRMLVALGTDGGTRAPADWVTEQVPGDRDGRPYYENAQTLGYAVGAVHVAVDDLASNRQERADAVKAVFTTTLGAAGGAGGPWGGAAASVLSGLGSEAIDAAVDRYRDGDRQLVSTLRDLAFPRTAEIGPDGQPAPYNGGAEEGYDSALGRVIDAH